MSNKLTARISAEEDANALQELLSVSGEELSPLLRFGDATQSALMPSILDTASKVNYEEDMGVFPCKL
jgi:hypothetical protein